MLKQRVITALVMLAVLLPALFAPSPWPFALLTLAAMGAAGWEWGRLNQASTTVSVTMGVLLAVSCGLTLSAGWAFGSPTIAWAAAAAIWMVGGVLVLASGPKGWPHAPVALRWLLGLMALWAAWLALTQARVVGVNFLLSVFCVVWAADIGAYFGGRALGRRKLAPSISPAKSWEGVYSGMLAVLALAIAWMQLDQHFAMGSSSLFTVLRDRLDWIGAALALVVLAGMSVVGDLVESLVKRAAGAKDSSRLLPGHGGVLDRIDALLPVLPIALAMSAL